MSGGYNTQDISFPVSAANGGTGVDSSASTGIAHVTAGVWTFSPVDLASSDISGTLLALNGGTSGDSSASTGIAHVSGGVWSYSAVDLASADVTGLLPATSIAAAGTNGQVQYNNSGVLGGAIIEYSNVSTDSYLSTPTADIANNITIRSGDSTSGGDPGGNVNIYSGGGPYAGGSINITGGSVSVVQGTGGAINLTAGNGLDSSLATSFGASVNLTPGSSSGGGGIVSFNGGAGSGISTDGGFLILAGGTGYDSSNIAATPGQIIAAGGHSNGDGGSFELDAGASSDNKIGAIFRVNGGTYGATHGDIVAQLHTTAFFDIAAGTLRVGQAIYGPLDVTVVGTGNTYSGGTSNFLVGYASTISTGTNNNILVGIQSSLTGSSCVAIGHLANSTAGSDKTFVGGYNAHTDGIGALAIGNVAYASGATAISIGDNSNAAGASATAVGNGANASAASATAYGVGSSANQASSLAVGIAAIVTTAGPAVAVGRTVKTVAANSVAMGIKALTANSNEFVINAVGAINQATSFQIQGCPDTLFTGGYGYSMFAIDPTYSVSTVASRVSRAAFSSYYIGTKQEGFRIESASDQARTSIGGVVVSGVRLHIYAGVATDKGLVIKGFTSQSANLFEVQNSSATQLTYIDAAGNVGVRQGATASTAYLHIAAGTTAASTAPLKFTSGSLQTTAEAGAVEFLTDKFYGVITTGAARKEIALNDSALTSGTVPVATTNGRLQDGIVLTKIPVVQSTNRSTAQTAAKTLTAFTVGASDASFLVSANVLITASTLHSFSVTCSYTDESNTARVLTLNFSQLTGTFVTTLTNALGASAYEGVPVHIRCKASTTITIASTGTFTTVVYSIEQSIIELN